MKPACSDLAMSLYLESSAWKSESPPPPWSASSSGAATAAEQASHAQRRRHAERQGAAQQLLQSRVDGQRYGGDEDRDQPLFEMIEVFHGVFQV